MYPETEIFRDMITNAEAVLFKRRLVDRVFRLWKRVSRSGSFPSQQQISPSMLDNDWPNCCLIAVRTPVNLSYFVALGQNLSFTHCPDYSLAGVLLAQLPQVLSERRWLMIEGRAILRG